MWRVPHLVARFEKRLERGVDFHAARYVGSSCASMFNGVHMEAHRAHKARRRRHEDAIVRKKKESTTKRARYCALASYCGDAA
jgi:hypothetical protein